jgi:hypothetical protein
MEFSHLDPGYRKEDSEFEEDHLTFRFSNCFNQEYFFPFSSFEKQKIHCYIYEHDRAVSLLYFQISMSSFCFIIQEAISGKCQQLNF